MHEHQQTGRDAYVRINWSNIEPGMEHNFDKLNTRTTTDYDFRSIMHYARNAFSTTNDPTIVAHSSTNDALMGQRGQLSERDIISVMRVYGEHEDQEAVLSAPNLVGRNYVHVDFVRRNNGILVNLVDGPAHDRFVEGICESWYYWPRIEWQRHRAGTPMRLDERLDVRTVYEPEFYYRPPPPGYHCP